MQQSKPSNPLIIRRKWSKVIQPIVQYKRSNCQLNFPLDFFYQIEKMIETGYILRLNIPQTLTGAHDNFLQTEFQGEEQIGEIKLTPSYSKLKFEGQIEKMNKQNIKKIRNKAIIQDFLNQQQQTINNKIFMFPFVVMKQKLLQNQQYLSNTMIWNSYEYKKISNIDVSQISQAYIFTKNLTASVTRYFYYSNSSKSVAYKIDNEQSFAGKNRSKQLWKVKQDRQYSCTFIKIMHENKSFNTQTLNLIKGIQKYLNKEVFKLVTDWVIDTNNRYYLIDIKQIQLVQPKPKYRISRSLTQLLSTVTCGMCLQTCNQSQISKTLTNKLINTFYNHLKKRGVSLSFRINVNKTNNLSKVCDICYSLVVEESKLIQAQNKMRLACNFAPVFTEYCNNFTEMNQIQSKLMMPKLYQWRLFLYLQNISNFFQLFADLARKYQDVTTIYLNLWIHESLTTFQITSPFNNEQQIKAIKIEHLFSQTLDMSQFLQKADLRVQILLKPNSTKPLAQGCIHGIQTQQHQKMGQSSLQRKYKQMLIFNENSKYCVLGLYVGVCNDGLVSTLGFDLKKTMNIFKLEGENVNCLSLPAEWMEILDHNYCQYQQKIDNNSIQNVQTNDGEYGKSLILRDKINSVTSSTSTGFNSTKQRSWSQKKLLPQISQYKSSQVYKQKLTL